MILLAQPGLQEPSKVSHSEEGGNLLGKQLQRGSFIKSHPKIAGSSLYLLPAYSAQIIERSTTPDDGCTIRVRAPMLVFLCPAEKVCPCL